MTTFNALLAAAQQQRTAARMAYLQKQANLNILRRATTTK